jgi:hypothetical protein
VRHLDSTRHLAHPSDSHPGGEKSERTAWRHLLPLSQNWERGLGGEGLPPPCTRQRSRKPNRGGTGRGQGFQAHAEQRKDTPIGAHRPCRSHLQQADEQAPEQAQNREEQASQPRGTGARKSAAGCRGNTPPLPDALHSSSGGDPPRRTLVQENDRRWSTVALPSMRNMRMQQDLDPGGSRQHYAWLLIN